MTYTLGASQIALLQEAYDAVAASTSTEGKWAKVYEMLFAMISLPDSSATEEVLSNQTAADILNNPGFETWWENWGGLSAANLANWVKADSGIESGAWVFLRGVSNVNYGEYNPNGEHPYSEFIRTYTAVQFSLRFESGITEGDIQA